MIVDVEEMIRTRIEVMDIIITKMEYDPQQNNLS